MLLAVDIYATAAKKKWNMQIKCVPKLKSFRLWNLGSVLHHLTENAVLEKAEEKKKKKEDFSQCFDVQHIVI